MSSSVSTSLEDSSTEHPLRGVLKKPGSQLRRRTLSSPPPSFQLPLDDDDFDNTVTPGLENSFKMVPDTKFNSDRARRLAEDILHRNFHDVKYEHGTCRKLVVKASEELKECVKGLGCNRFKFVCVVYLGSLQSQGMAITSRCVMDERFDRCATVSYRNTSLYVVATIYRVFHE